MEVIVIFENKVGGLLPGPRRAWNNNFYSFVLMQIQGFYSNQLFNMITLFASNHYGRY
jgi:hypothetical protein